MSGAQKVNRRVLFWIFVMCFIGDRWRYLRKLQRKRSAIRRRWRSIQLVLFMKFHFNVVLPCLRHLTSLTCCRIEAVEKKHNREWEEDWGAKDRPKSPKSPRTPRSPSPAPPEIKTTPTTKAKSSRE